MGSARWDPKEWTTYAASTGTKSREEIFTSRHINDDLDPSKFTVRESVDSVENPNSTPLIIGSDVTGSMGMLAETIIKKDLGIIMKEIYDRKPVTDPHICCAAIGDAYCDTAPFQVTQFEADIRLAEQMEKFFIEQGGGGNEGESYNLALYFAAYKTKCDAITKRGRKGYMFTIGDEPPLARITRSQVKTVFGDDVQADLETTQLLTMVQANWHYFHLIVKPVRDAVAEWKDLLGQHCILVDDHEKLAEVIVSTIQIMEGADHDKVAKSWDGSTAVTVANATRGLVKGKVSEGVARF